MRELYTTLDAGVDCPVRAPMDSFSILSGHSIFGHVTNTAVTTIHNGSKGNPVIINLIERSTPSTPVHLVGTNLYFNSLSEASRETGHHLSQLSKHINGKLPDLNGDVFEILEPTA